MRIDRFNFRYKPSKVFKALQGLGLFFLLVLTSCGDKNTESPKEAPEENNKEVKEKIQTTQEEIVSLENLLEENIAKSSGQLQEKLNTWKDILQYLKDEVNAPEFQQKNKTEQADILEQIKVKKDSIEGLVKEVFP